MRLTKPSAKPAPTSLRGGLSHAIRPQWLKDWIADQGHYVKLACGHKDNLNDRALLIIAAFGKSQVTVFCERCNLFTAVVRKMTFREYANITAVIPDDPLF